MPDTDALQILNISIDSIGAEDAGNSKNNINTDATQESNDKQEMYEAVKCCANTTSISKSTNNSNGSTINTNANTLMKYFLSSPSYETDKRKCAELTQQIHKEFDNVFNGIGCFEGIFLLQLKPDSRPYQVPPRCVAYVLQKPFKDKLDRLQQLDIITQLEVDEMSEWCNSFVLLPKTNSKVRLCLDPTWLNQALIRPIHRGSTLNDILPKFNNVKYVSIIDANSG